MKELKILRCHVNSGAAVVQPTDLFTNLPLTSTVQFDDFQATLGDELTEQFVRFIYTVKRIVINILLLKCVLDT